MIFCGLQKSFQNDTRLNIAAESPNLRSLRQRVASGEFQIALVEWAMVAWHDHESLNLLQEISSYTYLLLLGMTESTRDRKYALELGVRGIVSKRSTAHQVRKALCRVAEGGLWLEKSAAEALLNHVFSPASGPVDELQRIELLTRREREIIGLVCRGLRNKEIASTLFISESTVWHHLTSVFGKLRVADRVSLVAFAYRHGLNTFVEKSSIAKPAWPFLLNAARGKAGSKRALPNSPSVAAELIA
jgi:DNA-binding NarL/FixJ family response regulator